MGRRAEGAQLDHGGPRCMSPQETVVKVPNCLLLLLMRENALLSSCSLAMKFFLFFLFQ